MPRQLRALRLLLLCLAFAGCSRAIQVGSDQPSQQYRLTVENLTGVTMVVSYNDTRGDAILGNVGAGRTEYFVIVRPASATIAVRGQAASGTRVAGPYTVTLREGTPQVVRLQ